MMRKLTQKQEKFVLNVFNGMPQCRAYIEAGYSAKNALATIDQHASALAHSDKIMARLAELRQKAEDESVMGVLERKQRLTEIARTKITDFMELGQDGSWVNLGPKTPKGGAIQEIHSRTEYDDNGANPTVHTSVKLHDPLRAIAELNKMEKVYEDGDRRPNQTLNQVVFNLQVLSDEELNALEGIARKAAPLLEGHTGGTIS